MPPQTTNKYQKFFEGLYNVSGFDGTIESDFLKLGAIPDERKEDLIDYDLNSFDDYRLALQDYLKAVYPLDYNNFAASDLGQMVLEMFAYLAATLALRTDMTANEMYLDTVKNEDNLRRLLQLIGVSMKGPTSSKATGTLILPQTPSSEVTVQELQRTISVTNTRSGTPLTYTLYGVRADGSLDLFSRDISIPAAEFTDDTFSYAGLFLLEGVEKTQSGNFAPAADKQVITITDGPVIEGSIGVSSMEDGGLVYNEISNLFVASGGTSPVFEKRYLDNFTAQLIFGDGIRGRLPQPNQNFVVTYRVGGGPNGNIARNLIDQDINVLHGAVPMLATIKNTTKGTGGAPAETVAHAKRYAPYFFRTQYRAVTGEDYNVLANSFVGTAGSTAKAMASLRKNGAAANVIDLFVLAKASETQLERASVAFKAELLDYLKDYKMLTDDVVISDGVIRTMDLVCTIYIDKANLRYSDNIKAKAAQKVVEYFGVDNSNFGETLSRADLTNFMLTVPEVRFFSVDNLDRDIYVNFNEIVQLNNFEFTVEIV